MSRGRRDPRKRVKDGIAGGVSRLERTIFAERTIPFELATGTAQRISLLVAFPRNLVAEANGLSNQQFQILPAGPVIVDGRAQAMLAPHRRVRDRGDASFLHS